MKMRAALLYTPQDLHIVETDAPRCEDDQALIRIHNCGVCPSDVRFYTGDRPMIQMPQQLGHEWAGEIVEVGKDVANLPQPLLAKEGSPFKVGDRVVPDWRVTCGQCPYCRRGVFNFCSNPRHHKVAGGYCEYGVALASNLRRIPDHVSFEEACFTEPLACCLNGSKMCRIQPGDDVVIVGTGQIGLMHLQLARHAGARVIACDTIEERLQLAQQLGAHETICVSRENAVARVKDLTDGRGANAVLVAVGSVQAMEMALEMAGINATINFFAGTYPPQTFPLDPNVIHYKQLNVTGSHDFTPHDFTTALKLIALGVVKVKPLITHRFPLERTAEAFDMVTERRGVKVMVVL